MTTHRKEKILSAEEIRQAIESERRWLQNNAVSAVTDGPVEDLEGVPLPADTHQGTPPAHSTKVSRPSDETD